jgi:REP element-mobilizing transposase RayT
MLRTARASVGEIGYHVINRRNVRQDVFRKKGDYQAFVDLIGRASERVCMRLLA